MLSVRPPAYEFTATGQSASAKIAQGYFSIKIKGGVGTVALQRSDDDGATWDPVSIDSAGNPAIYTINNTTKVLSAHEPVGGALYRFNCTYTSGTITCEIKQR